MRSPGRAPPRHIPMVPAGPPLSGKRPGGGCHPNPSGYIYACAARKWPVYLTCNSLNTRNINTSKDTAYTQAGPRGSMAVM